MKMLVVMHVHLLSRTVAIISLFLSMDAQTAAKADSFERGFQEGVVLYESGDFFQAQERFETLVREYGWTASLAYNLGNVAFRRQDPGLAILYYERALLLQPSHAEARSNLQLVREITNAQTLPLAWWSRVYEAISPQLLVWLASGAFWVGVLSVFMIRRQSLFAPPAWVTLWVSLFVFGGAMTLLLASRGGPWNPSRAILLAGESVVRSAPTRTARELTKLRAGSEVRLKGERGLWALIDFGGAQPGWIPLQMPKNPEESNVKDQESTAPVIKKIRPDQP